MSDTRAAPTICGCGGPVRDGYLCKVCTRQLHDDLVEIAPGKQMLPSYALGAAGRGTTTRWDTPSAVMVGGLADDLTTTAARQARIGRADGGAEKPIPFNPRAAEIRSALTNTLRPWAMWLHGLERPPAVVNSGATTASELLEAANRAGRWTRQRRELEHADTGRLAGYLAQRVDVIRRDQAAVELASAVHDVVARVRAVIDRDPDRVAVGQCGAELPDERLCTEQLYAEPENTYVTCPACETTWTVSDRRAWLLAGAHDELATAATIAAGLTRLDAPVTADRIYQWKHRGKLIDYGQPCEAHRVPLWVETGRHVRCPDCGPALYRVGDVVRLLTASMVAATARRAKTERAKTERAKSARVKRQRDLLKRSKAGSAAPGGLGPGLVGAIEDTVRRRRAEAG